MREGSISQRHLRSCPRDDSGRLLPHRCRGNWRFTLEEPRGGDGRRRQIQRGGFATKREAQAALEEELARRRAGLADTSGLTVGAYLEQWLAGKRKIRATTRRNYAVHLRRYLIPELGGIRLADLRPHHVDSLYSDVLESRYPGATAITVHHIHRSLRSALNAAVKRRLIPWNPAQHVELPERRRTVTTVWSAGDLGRFLDLNTDDRLYALWHLLGLTGMRRGEAIGLHWQDTDLLRLQVVVRTQVTDAGDGPHLTAPKTAAGARVIPIDAGTGEVLRRHAQRQAAERMAWGEAWQALDLVFARADGGMLRPDWITHRFAGLVKRAGLPPIRLHDLRHTHASLALSAGIELKVVSDRLGHSTTAITADLYTHVVPSVAQRAADAIAGVIPLRRSVAGADVGARLAQDPLRRSGTDPPRDEAAGQGWSRHRDSNPEPPDYKSGALPVAPCRRDPPTVVNRRAGLAGGGTGHGAGVTVRTRQLGVVLDDRDHPARPACRHRAADPRHPTRGLAAGRAGRGGRGVTIRRPDCCHGPRSATHCR